jgi:RNA polymerase sigma factor (TIGR02999 family)
MTPQAVDITKLLAEVRRGDPAASAELMEAIYSDLRAMAHRIFSNERPDHTLEPTALVHEAWIRIFSGAGAEVEWKDRLHFYAVAARQMRRLLVDHGRKYRAQKHGGGLKVPLDDNLHGARDLRCDVGEVNLLLDRLQRNDPQAAQVVELKVFSGMTDDEIAAQIKVSKSNVRRHWTFAKAWLIHQQS